MPLEAKVVRNKDGKIKKAESGAFWEVQTWDLYFQLWESGWHQPNIPTDSNKEIR